MNNCDTDSVENYIKDLSRDESLGLNFVSHKTIYPVQGGYADITGCPESLVQALKKTGITCLYQHQAEAIDLIRSGNSVVVSTPTASGKSLIYNIPVFESILGNRDSRALYLFPLKALTQDQHLSIRDLAGALSGHLPVWSAVYDGDTDLALRRAIRSDPPNIILTNPDMLHCSFLPYHRGWKKFFSSLRYVIVDEVHTYRGVMGSNMAWVFRRLARICSYYGSRPVFIFSSATIRNPSQLTSLLTGMECQSVSRSTAPQGKKHVFLVESILSGAAGAAINLLDRALKRGLRTIVYTQSRKMTELIAMWCAEKSGPFKSRISSYRAGFLPEQRREIESRLLSGELLAVVSTSALELGIDVGHLDVCILVGYPGSIMATWQRAGRVGRSGRESAVFLVGHEDALDQYFLRHPQEFFSMEPESAVINPYNPNIMSRHLVCAASDLPLRAGEEIISPQTAKCIGQLENEGRLVSASNRDYFYTREEYPHKNVDLRGSSGTYGVFEHNSGEFLGEIDQARVFHEAHPGAIYLHMGKIYLVQELNTETKSVFVKRTRASYYTRTSTHKVTEIIEVHSSGKTGAGEVCTGRLKVTEQVVDYEKRLVRGQKVIGVVPLDLPPVVFETEGFWLTIDESLQRRIEKRLMHFMGGIHALEHCLIGVLPMIVLTDRNDLGGISTPVHQQLKKGAVFVYDGVPGGIGLSTQAYALIDRLLKKAMQVMASCSCENGCPACVHSPKCGSGNRPLDKEAAKFILAEMTGETGMAESTAGVQQKSAAAGTGPAGKQRRKFSFAVLDIETRHSAQEVGGWGNSHLMGVSCSVVYDSISEEFKTFFQDQTDQLGSYLKSFDLVVGFNVLRFDYRVLKGQSRFDFHCLPTVDMLVHVEKRLGHRLSLNHLAENTLGARKSADGLLALKWWKQGEIGKIVEYCKKDVAITRDLYQFGLENGHVLYQNKSGRKVRIPVSWEEPG